MKLPLLTLKSLLLKNNVVNEDQFQKAVMEGQRTGKDIVDILISQGLMTRPYFSEILSQFFHVQLVRLVGQSIPQDIFNLLTEDIVRSRQIAIYGKEGNRYQLAMIDPGDLEAIDFTEKLVGGKVDIAITNEEDIQYVLSLYRQSLSVDFQKIIEDNIKASSSLASIKEQDAAKEMPIVSIVDNTISYAMSLRASDIHIESLPDTVMVRFRVDGMLREMMQIGKVIQPAVIARIKLLSGLQIDEHYKPQDGRFKYKSGNEMVDIRVSVIPTMHGEKIVMRLLTGTTKPMSFAELGMLPETIAVMEENIKKSFGMILVTGPTGCGKSTTLYAVLDKLNKPNVNISTIEDPVEYDLKYINQIQVNVRAGVTFASGLRALLRQDPNIIMVGEIRDEETAQVAVQAALTGHLVLTTLHTNDATTAIPRLMDMKVEPFLVASTVNAVIAQRLARRVCTRCIESYPLEDITRTVIEEQLKATGRESAIASIPKTLYKGKGCKFCNNTGYRGRVAIYEILNISEPMRLYIQKPEFALDGLRIMAAKEGMISMFEDGLKKAELGQTTVEELFRIIKE
ncbi:MAG: GspE/PulE family protein [Candidatus Parcubacteria bacterium]|nr:GspE/PulE family protein [Candidatus Parcubacteria bacterium]